MVEFLQSDFRGGLNLFDQDAVLQQNEYGLAFNVRNRKTSLAPVKAEVEDASLPIGKKQGLYAFDIYLLAFVNGHAYYKNVVTDSAWTAIANLFLDPTVEYIYCELVPASKVNFERKLISSSQVEGTPSNNPVNTTSLIINGTPAGLVVQDGVNQPWLVYIDGLNIVARPAQRYADWTKANREYVPIMRQMKYLNGILFGIATDGRTIYRSVSGRPLDFVVNITMTGDKGGDAATTAYSTGFDQVTLLSSLDTGELLVGTLRNLFPVEFNYEKTIFAEPTFLNRRSIAVGVVNQFSFLSYLRDDDLSDYFLIDTDGMRYLRATKDRNEGRNSAFSLRIANVLVEKQTGGCCILFNDYSMFSVATIYGHLIAVYDNKREQWVCFDRITDTDPIKQFAVADQSSSPTLYCITDAKIYKLEKSESYLQATVSLKANVAGRVNLKLDNVNTILVGAAGVHDVTVTEVVDSIERKVLSKGLTADNVDNIYFNFHNLARQGWKVGLKIQWQDASELLLVGATLTEVTPQNPYRQQR